MANTSASIGFYNLYSNANLSTNSQPKRLFRLHASLFTPQKYQRLRFISPFSNHLLQYNLSYSGYFERLIGLVRLSKTAVVQRAMPYGKSALFAKSVWWGARVVEWNGLENRRGACVTVGSNPTPTAFVCFC